MTRLLPPGAYTGFLGALCVPDDLYWVCRTPVALAGMAYPGRADWTLLHAHRIGHVVALTHDAQAHAGGAVTSRPQRRSSDGGGSRIRAVPYDAGPCTVAAYRLQDLVSGGPPADPEREQATVERAAGDVVAHLRGGIGVAVHCMGGRGRTGTVLGVALVQLGHSPDDVVDYLHCVAVGRGRRGWPESAWQETVVRQCGRAQA